jgi:hypothetical protein
MARTAMRLLDRVNITGNVCVFQTVLQLLNHYNLMTTPQVRHWTLDNAANNGTFLEELKILFRECDIDFDHLDRRIVCILHVVNICCQHVIAKFTNVDLIDLAHVAELPSAFFRLFFGFFVTENAVIDVTMREMVNNIAPLHTFQI